MSMNVRTAVVVVSLALITGCSPSTTNDSGASAPVASTKVDIPDINGFKDAKFGMTTQELESLGYYCHVTRDEGVDQDFNECRSSTTLFGLPAIAVAHFIDGKVVSIVVTAEDNKPIDLNALYSDALGTPIYHKKRNAGDLTNEFILLWIAKNNAGVAILGQDKGTRTAINDGSMEIVENGVPKFKQTAHYYNEAITTKLHLDILGSHVAPESDF